MAKHRQSVRLGVGDDEIRVCEPRMGARTVRMLKGPRTPDYQPLRVFRHLQSPLPRGTPVFYSTEGLRVEKKRQLTGR